MHIFKIHNQRVAKIGTSPIADSLPSLNCTGEPNSSNQLYNPDGSLKQERKYGVDGTPEYDDDYNHAGDGHGIGFPHRHTWENGERSKDAISIPQINSSNSIDWKLMTVAGIATLIEVVTWSFGMPVDIPGN